MDGTIEQITAFADRLDGAHIQYRLEVARKDAVMFCVSVPGERWEIEFMRDGNVEVEIFRGNGSIRDGLGIEELFERFSD